MKQLPIEVEHFIGETLDEVHATAHTPQWHLGYAREATEMCAAPLRYHFDLTGFYRRQQHMFAVWVAGSWTRPEFGDND